MAGLVEQRGVYMTKLQSLIDERNADITSKISTYKAQLDAEVAAKVDAYKAQLEADKVTPEIAQLVQFVHQIDAMIDYDKNGIAASTDEADEDAEDVEETPIASENVNEKAINETARLDGTGFEAIAADLADTRARLNAADSSRNSGGSIVLPRH